MKSRIIMAVLLVMGIFRVDMVYAGVPIDSMWIWGNPKYIKYDAQRHVFRNHNWLNELWLRHDQDMMKKLLEYDIPEQQKIVITFRIQDGKHENHYDWMVVAMACSQRRIRPFFVHCAQDPEYSERLDTIMMMNGSIAALNSVADQLRRKYGFLEDGTAIDESYPAANIHDHRDFVFGYLGDRIEQLLMAGEEPVVFCTLLSYNAEKTLLLLRNIKSVFGPSVRTGIGGQLVRVNADSYRQMPFIDQVGIGDAEIILEPLLIGRKPFASGYLTLESGCHYAPLSYNNYLGLNERLDEMSRYKFGPFSDFRQLAVESVRGCAWAFKMGKACEMCSLESITTHPIFKPFEDYFAIENKLAEQFGINWIFDVSNQFVPVIGEEKQEKWLKSLLKAKKKYSRFEINKYVYLTSNSITERTAPLLREVGIRLPYIGIDGWDTATRKALNKPQVDPKKILRLCRDNDLYTRIGIVIGSGLNKQNIQELPKFAEELIGEFKGTILTWGNFLEIILPGSHAWYEFQKAANRNNWKEAINLYQFFYREGFLTWPQQEKMTELYIRLFQKADYDEVVAACNKAIEIISPHTVSITFRTGGQLEKA